MDVLVLYSKKSSPSARWLINAIREMANLHGVADLNVFGGTPTSRKIYTRKYDYIINVGNSVPPMKNLSSVIINHPSKIAVSVNKRLARMRFKAQRISAPPLWLNIKDIPIAEFPVVGRTTFHMKAKGFWLCNTPKEAEAAFRAGATHFMKFIKNTLEFRAHVFANTTMPKSAEDYIIAKLSEKRGYENAKTTVIKNHDNGYKFVSSKAEQHVLREVRVLAKEVIHKFGLHYGGVDIVYSLDNKKAYVLEINTTPCLTDENSTTAESYAAKFLTLMGVTLEGDHD